MAYISIRSAIETAIKAEELGITFYSELSRQYGKNAELKQMFELLAKDEVEHKRQFNDMLKDYGESNFETTDLDDEFLKCIDISKFFPGMDHIDPQMTPEAVLIRAYTFEKESVLYYMGMRDIIGKSAHLDEIIRIEKIHATRLMRYLLEGSKFRGIIDK